MLRFAAIALLAAPLLHPLHGQDSLYARQHYAKREVYITARDGTRLFTSIYAPRDTSQAYPILLSRTPYGVAPYGDTAYKTLVGPNPLFMRDGYIIVYQDVRGRYMSEGTYVYMTPHREKRGGAPAAGGSQPAQIDESTDTYDTIDWLVKNIPNNNGRVGTWGISAPGFFTAAGMIDAHPAHKAASPQAPLIDWFMGDDRHHNGALMLAQTFNFLSGFDKPRTGPTRTYAARPPYGTPDGYRFFLDMATTANADNKYFHNTATFWDSIMKHDSYDAFWQARSLSPHLRNITPAVLNVGGWYDGEDPYGPLEAYRAIEKQSPATTNTLVVGPWSHGAWSRVTGDVFGAIPFGQKTGDYYRDSVEFPFFACHLKNRCGTPLPKAVVFQTGANQWRKFDAWPPKTAQPMTLYLHAGGGVSPNAPAKSEPASDEYVSDPKHPVPYTTAVSFGYYRDYPIEDQRFAASRPDVLVFQTDVLTDSLTLAGPIKVSLKVSTSGTDADWIVKVIDVYPDTTTDPKGTPAGVHLAGYQQLVRGDVMRGKFRDSFTHPKPFVPNKPATVPFTIQDVFHTFRPGHRLMVQVQSTWFPLVDRNPQKFMQINTATEADFQKATQRVFHSAAQPSSLTVLVLPNAPGRVTP